MNKKSVFAEFIPYRVVGFENCLVKFGGHVAESATAKHQRARLPILTLAHHYHFSIWTGLIKFKLNNKFT